MAANNNMQRPFSIEINCHPHPLGLQNPGNEGDAYTCMSCKFMDNGRRYSCRTCNGYSMHEDCAIRAIQQPPAAAGPTTRPATTSPSVGAGGLATMAVVRVGSSVLGHQISNAMDAEHLAGQSATVNPPIPAADDYGYLESVAADDDGGVLESIIELLTNLI